MGHEREDERGKKTLFVNMSSSYCGNCGQPTLPDGETHEEISGYGGGGKGCGVKWEYVSTDYVGESLERAIKRVRPDLEFYPCI